MSIGDIEMTEDIEKAEEKATPPLSDPLQDVVDIAKLKPELSQTDWEIVEKAIPYIKALVRPDVRIEVIEQLEVKYARKYEELAEEVKRANTEQINAQFEALKKAQEPLKKEDIDKLLSQEYTEFSFKIRYKSTDSGQDFAYKTFTIVEQSSAIEEKFYKILKKIIEPVLQEQSNIQFKLDKGSLLDKVQTILTVSETALAAGAELVSTILDPWKKDSDINPEWVKNNLSIERQAAIVMAQVEANKYRDFFSTAFRPFLSLRA
jgi:hypothetical protein